MAGIRIDSAETMERVIREVGFIPFFRNRIPGFSIQEMTPREYWFDGEEGILGPWDWKIECVRSGDIAYGKFLCGGKASFATVEWYREIMNLQRSRFSPDEAGEKILGYISTRGRGKWYGSLTEQLVFIPYLMSGVAFSTMYFAMFSTSHLGGLIPSLYGTFTLIVLTSVVKHFPFASRSGTANMMQIADIILDMMSAITITQQTAI